MLEVSISREYCTRLCFQTQTTQDTRQRLECGGIRNETLFGTVNVLVNVSHASQVYTAGVFPLLLVYSLFLNKDTSRPRACLCPGPKPCSRRTARRVSKVGTVLRTVLCDATTPRYYDIARNAAPLSLASLFLGYHRHGRQSCPFLPSLESSTRRYHYRFEPYNDLNDVHRYSTRRRIPGCKQYVGDVFALSIAICCTCKADKLL